MLEDCGLRVDDHFQLGSWDFDLEYAELVLSVSRCHVTIHECRQRTGTGKIRVSIKKKRQGRNPKMKK